MFDTSQMTHCVGGDGGRNDFERAAIQPLRRRAV